MFLRRRFFSEAPLSLCTAQSGRSYTHSSMVEHLSHKQKESGSNPASAHAWASTTLLSTRAAHFNSTKTHMDYSQFLQPSGALLELPYFGGNSVCDDTRTYRIRGTLESGWYRFRLSGRFVTKEAAVE